MVDEAGYKKLYCSFLQINLCCDVVVVMVKLYRRSGLGNYYLVSTGDRRMVAFSTSFP